MKRFKHWALDRLSTVFMWLSLHCECWNFGHVWNLSPNSAWCDRCEDRIEGEKARLLYEAKHGPYIPPPPVARKPMVVKLDLGCPPDMVYVLDMSKWPAANLPVNGCFPSYAEKLPTK